MIFVLDATGEAGFDGYTVGQPWNGWACPYFTFEQAQEILIAWHLQGWDAHFDTGQDAFLFFGKPRFETGQSEDFETFTAFEMECRKLYPIGAFSWTWEEKEFTAADEALHP